MRHSRVWWGKPRRFDVEGTQGLFDRLWFPFRASEVLIGLRRLGKATGIVDQPRPLLIFKKKQTGPCSSREHPGCLKIVMIIGKASIKSRG